MPRKAAVEITAYPNGKVRIHIDKEMNRQILVSLSQAVCGAFDVAGEHEKEVMDTMTRMAMRAAQTGEKPKEPDPVIWQ